MGCVKEPKTYKDLFSLVINLIPLFLWPTKHDKILFHKVFSIKATKLTQSVAICFSHNCCSRSREKQPEEKGHHCYGSGTNEETLNSSRNL